jgi:hypothetical protein
VAHLYHQTLQVNVEAVLRDGLLPRSRHDGEKAWRAMAGCGVHPDGVYMVASPHHAHERCDEDGSGAIIQIDASFIDPARLTVDPEVVDALVCEDEYPSYGRHDSLLQLLLRDPGCLKGLEDGDFAAAACGISDASRWPVIEYCLRLDLPMLYLGSVSAAALSLVNPASLRWLGDDDQAELDEHERLRRLPIDMTLTRSDWPSMLHVQAGALLHA